MGEIEGDLGDGTSRASAGHGRERTQVGTRSLSSGGRDHPIHLLLLPTTLSHPPPPLPATALTACVRPRNLISS